MAWCLVIVQAQLYVYLTFICQYNDNQVPEECRSESLCILNIPQTLWFNELTMSDQI